MSYPLPDNETQRLKALHEYAVLDTAPEQAYDDFTFLASVICDVPVALISLIDKDRQWFKSRVGLEAGETSRDLAFCAHTIMGDQVMVVPDATQDERFLNNPLVTADPSIRFYAGAPLITPEGFSIGTLCTIDHKPRPLHPVQEQALKSLARQLMGLLEFRRVSQVLANTLDKVKIMEGLIPICSHCKSIRSDEGFWSALEKYLAEHADIELTHGICDACMQKHFPDHLDEPSSPA